MHLLGKKVNKTGFSIGPGIVSSIYKVLCAYLEVAVHICHKFISDYY